MHAVLAQAIAAGGWYNIQAAMSYSKFVLVIIQLLLPQKRFISFLYKEKHAQSSLAQNYLSAPSVNDPALL